jgi:hypothetical protein
MYSFESLYPCSRVTIEDGALTIGGIFAERGKEGRPAILVARVSGAKANRPIGYEVSLVRMAPGSQEVWHDKFELLPPSGGYRPVELAVLMRGTEVLSTGVYIATMLLDDGQQASISFDVK